MATIIQKQFFSGNRQNFIFYVYCESTQNNDAKNLTRAQAHKSYFSVVLFKLVNVLKLSHKHVTFPNYFSYKLGYN